MEKPPKVQRVIDGITGIFHFKDGHGIGIEVELTDVALDEHGNPTGTLTAADEFAMDYVVEKDVPLPAEIIDSGELPFELQPKESKEHGHNTSKIIVIAGIGALVVGATYIGAKYRLNRRK